MSTSKNNAFDTVIPALPDATSYIVAYSGGVDSHVLLHLLAGQREKLCAPLMAVHVDHGIQSQSGEWRAHCESVCDQLKIPFHALQTDGVATPGESPEAAARHARYRVLADWLPEGAALLTAQHRDDQAETLLLQLFRGAGPRGLSAMPPVTSLGQGLLLRPFLDVSRADVLDLAQTCELDWIEDPSNTDTRYDRNLLRHEVLPQLRQRWPGLHTVLARAAAHQSEQAGLADALAGVDLSASCSTDGERLLQSGVKVLAPARQRNLLRYWIHRRGFAMPSQAVLERIREEMLYSRDDAQPVVHWGRAELRRYRGELYLMQALPAQDTSQCMHWDLRNNPELGTASGVLYAKPVTGEGLYLPDETSGVDVRFRRGGESLLLPGASHHRTLKNLLQEHSVPGWERERLPLLYSGETLVAVPGIAICEGFQAQAGQAGFALDWSRHRNDEVH
ncbi:tRNA(Ile)-lysidine synthase [Thiogranum longum]|uniref:tRNA(Ile)-lysidine synthase n=1 Tax=Thiogranum longum TaxID=1537524 RepID=A0A4V2PGX1_9GAMM|nr:tRNA lysidine(34) synthetase TilS [Thiogranum longum]TCK18436.1 tRNA(Ile)-lysidine synthase [Thiogranum longum]